MCVWWWWGRLRRIFKLKFSAVVEIDAFLFSFCHLGNTEMRGRKNLVV